MLLLLAAPARAQDGVDWVGRWVIADDAAVATYAGSAVRLSFGHSSSVAADLTVLKSRGVQDLFISIAVDGGKPLRMGLSAGAHEHVVLASGLSSGAHQVVVRKEGEPVFGALRFAGPKLDPGGRWRAAADARPIVEVIGDSDATGICALGPDSPAESHGIYNSQWASQSMSWVGLLEAELAGVGHPVDMVDLAISGSKTGSEAKSYDLAAPRYSDARFAAYAHSGRAQASLVLLWGGANDRHGGGDTAGESPVTYEHLSKFQKGVYDQISEIVARNPDAKIVLLDYIDPTIPAWRAAYDQVVGLLPEEQRKNILFLRVYDPKGKADACETDPKGHPNLSMHQSWAAQIFAWMMSPEVFARLDFPSGEQWYDD
jgi:Carbohydrate esterase 2 N-terminal/GDSL-like Lipase/Acylhydrolase family